MKIKKRYIFLLILALIGLLVWAGILWWRGGPVRYVTATPAQYAAKVLRNISYLEGSTTFSPKNQLDLHLPIGLDQAPVAVILHGGGWTLGDRGIPEVQKIAEWFAQRGTIGVPMGYRLVPQVSVLEQAADVAAGVAWVYRHINEYGGNPERIFLLGHSAGGQLASLILCDREYLDRFNIPHSIPAGMIALSTPFFFTGQADQVNPLARKMAEDVFHHDPKLCAAASPLKFVHSGMPPFLILIGTGDHIVPADQAPKMTAALQAAGNPVILKKISGRGHINLFHRMIEPGDIAGETALAFINGMQE